MRSLSVGLASLALALGAAQARAADPAPPAAEPAAIAPVDVRDGGLVAEYFAAPGARHLPAVILLGGSEGGLNPAVAREAQALAAHGYAVLQLAYFGADGLPPKLTLIPLEYFGHAIDWLQARHEIDRGRIGIEGASIGGETALVVASHDSRIKVVVAAMPSSVVWPGIDPTNPIPPSTFSSGGQPVADLPYGHPSGAFSIYALYDQGLQAIDQHMLAVIPVENINGPVMLVCGKADSLWPSCPMTEQIVSRLAAQHFAYQVTPLEYADAGHGAFGLPLDPANPHYAALGSLGGTPDGNNAARQDAWPKSVDFLDSVLHPD
jgi:hypothetical protein